MALRRLITNAVIPNFEKDVSRTLKKEIESVASLLDSMMVPQAYGFTSQQASAGVFRASALRAAQAPIAPSVKKVNFPVKQVGLFH